MTMLAPVSDTDLDVILIESLDFEPACQIGNEGPSVGKFPPCQNAAEWAYRCRGCGLTACYCTEHKAALNAELWAYSQHPLVKLFSYLPGQPNTGLRCRECNIAITFPLPWQPLK